MNHYFSQQNVSFFSGFALRPVRCNEMKQRLNDFNSKMNVWLDEINK